MPNINLLQAAPEKRTPGTIVSGNKSIAGSIALLAVALAVFGGFKFYTANLNKQISETEALIGKESSGLVGEEVDDIADVQERIANISSNLSAKKNSPQEILKKVEGVIVKGVVAQNFSEKDSQVTLKLQAKNFTEVSKQLVSFKEAAYFSDVTLTSLSRGEDGVAQFDLTMNIK